MEASNSQNGANQSIAAELLRTQELDSLITTFKDELAAVKAIAQDAQQSLLAITAAQSQVAAALADVQAKVTEITSASTVALAAKTQITDEQTVISAKSSHIEDAKSHADGVRAELDRALNAATKSVTDAEGADTRAKSAADSAVEALAAITTQKTQAETELTAIAAARELAKTAATATKALADKADVIEARVADYENKLAKSEIQANEQLATITGLLPGATSAGLAHAFDLRRKSFLKPGTRWQWLFVGSVAALVALALTGLWNVVKDGTPLSYDELLRLWLARAPIAGALIWLALHASRESALAKRLEEDYGYKAVIAASFQGFQE